MEVPSQAELIEEERLRFEAAAAMRLGITRQAIHRLRVDDGYGDRMYLVVAWHFWLAAVGLIEPAPDRPGNEHAIVDNLGRLLEDQD